jgi:ERF superfamily protein
VTTTDPAPATETPAPVERAPEGVDQLAAALALVQAELPPIIAREVAKVTGETKQGKPVSYSYKYADLATVAATIMPQLGKHGLSFTTWPTIISGRFVLRYELLHASGQRLGGLYPLNEDIRSPQAMGSQITYARRYCLCAVTGVAPEDDDDAAAAEGQKAAARAQQQEEVDAELAHARDAVRGAWANQFGPFDGEKAAELFRTWSRGGQISTATGGQLRAFAGYLHNLPVADAGSDPEDAQLLPSGEEQAAKPFDDSALSNRQRGQIFALFEDLGMKSNRGAQLEYLTTVTGRTIASRGDLCAGDADAVIKALKEDVDEARRSGLTPDRSEPATGAQSATGETRVPAGSEPPPDGGAQ